MTELPSQIYPTVMSATVWMGVSCVVKQLNCVECPSDGVILTDIPYTDITNCFDGGRFLKKDFSSLKNEIIYDYIMFVCL